MGNGAKAISTDSLSSAKARLSAALLFLLLGLATLSSPAHAAAPELFAQSPEDLLAGSEAGQIGKAFRNGIAADSNLPGHLYVADAENMRIDEFTPWGDFVRAWGWGVVDGKAELQTCTKETGCLKGFSGGGSGQFETLSAIAVDGAGRIYALDPRGHRVQSFGPSGAFLGAFGGDVVAHGPHDSPNDEQQRIVIAATGGTFKLALPNPISLEPSNGVPPQTGALPYDASAAEVEAALEALSAIAGNGGSVSVTGGPGDATGSSPYLVTFEGNLGGDDLPPLKIDSSSLSEPATSGYSLECQLKEAETEFNLVMSSQVDGYRWLRNGVPIPGATAPTYTTTVADQGKEIQCQVFAHNSTVGAMAITGGRLVAPAPPQSPPVAPTFGTELIRSGTGLKQVGSAGGQTFTCPTGGWTGVSSFSFAWYRNRVAIPGATGSTYTLTEADVVSPASFQCVITGANAEGTALSLASQLSFTDPQESTNTETAPFSKFPDWAVMSPPSRVTTPNEGGGLESCSFAAGDVCKVVFRHPTSNQIHERAGSLATDSNGTVFVAEGETVKVFEPGGAFKEAIAMPAGKTVGAIATDAAGDLYVAFKGEGNVYKLEPSGPTAELLPPVFAAEDPADRPLDLAVDGNGNLYVSFADRRDGETVTLPARVLKYGPSGNCLTCGKEGEKSGPGFDRGAEHAGVAASSACGVDDAYVLDIGLIDPSVGLSDPTSFIKLFGPPPDPDLCPQPARAPQVKTQFAISVTADEAELRSKINPRFWKDTSYHVEYGTLSCSQGGCTDTPEVNLTQKVTSATLASQSVLLAGLEPGTTYHYRFVAESGGGGPVYGADPDGTGPGEASFAEGGERTFTTARKSEVGTCPENEAFRIGPAALLPDCRGYEMVSPPDKGNADIAVIGEASLLGPAGLELSSTSGERLTYGSVRSFAGSPSAPLTSQYIAARSEAGWLTHPISPPLKGTGTAGIAEFGDTEFRFFSPDLCQAWLYTQPYPLLAPGAQTGKPNLYRRDDEECGGPAYETLSTSPGYDVLELQGLSADGSRAIYITNGPLTEDAPELGKLDNQLYYQEGAQTRYVCILPSGEPSQRPCAAGDSVVSGIGNATHYFVNVAGAISADGKRVFWMSGGNSSRGPIYMRERPGQPQSALLHGAATGTGKLTEGSTTVTSLVAASGKADFTSGSSTATLTETSVGKFVPGQPLSAGKTLPAGTTILAVSGSTLTLSASATETVAAKAILSTGPMPFEVGQSIAAPGIPAGTTITAVKAGELKLSQVATVTKSNVPLNALSPCSELTKACTIAVSEAAEAQQGSDRSIWLGAAKDGSVAVFATGGSLYEFAVDSRATHLIAGGFVGLMGMSEDASRIYFTSRKALTGLNGEGRSPVAGEVNLYLYERGEGGGQLRFVGTLEVSTGPADPKPDHVQPNRRASRVSPDGAHAAFISSASLTGYDNADVDTEAPDTEVFLYDAVADEGQGKLICASCNPSGSRPRGAIPQYFGDRRSAAWIPPFQNVFQASRVLLDDGQRLFFNAYDALLPRDTNGRADVYEWEAPGTGTCEESSPSYSPLNQGCIDLISSGKSLADSRFVDASSSGNDVFFATLSSFAPEDIGLLDIYDARVGGGFPAPPAPPAECEGEACQSVPEAPNDPTPSSESFEGAGNVREEAAPGKPAPCAKGKVKRHGKCVAKKHKKHRAKRKRRAGR